MDRKYKTLLFLFLNMVIIDSQETDNCSFALKKQILTCENVDSKSNNVENLITNSTQMLVLKNSDDLVLSPEFHKAPFEILTSYQIIGNKNLIILPFTFQKLGNVKYVKIMDNIYPTVQNNTFYGLTQCELLNMNNNSIQLIESGAFSTLSSLETLELTHNNFHVIPSFLFKGLKNLKSLFIYHCNIETLEENCLEGLNNLNVLDLTYNRLTQINTEMFNKLEVLSHLYLSFNQIESIEGDFTAPKLEFLYLQNNKLKVISNTMFNSLGNIMDLDISRNKINILPSDAFSNCTKLSNLNYKDNNLTSTVNLVFNGKEPFITS